MIDFIEYAGSEPIKSLDMDIVAAMDFGQAPTFFVMGNTQHAIMQAMMDFKGRDRRRIKREVRKATVRIRKPPRAF